MKRLALLTAAGLLASAPVFAMDGGGVSISGEANFGVKFAESDDDSKSELQFHHEFDVKFSASGTTDGGIGFGGSMSIDNTESVSRGKVNAAKTGYIVTKTDLTAAGLKALADKYGINPSALKEGDVIESGNTTNFSGYGKAEIAGHAAIDALVKDAVPAQDPVNYGRGDVLNNIRILDAVTTDGLTLTDNPDVLSLDADETVGGIVRLVKAIRTTGSGATEVEETVYFVTSQSLTDINGFTGWDDAEELANGRIVTIDTGVDDIPATTGNNALSKVEALGTGVIQLLDVSDKLTEADAKASGLEKTPRVFEVPGYTLTGADQAVRNARSQAYIDDLNASVTDADKHSVDNHGEVYISMDMHKLTIGSDLDAADKVAGGLADPGFDGIGIDDVAEGPYGESAADVRYDGDFGVASVAISYGDNKGDADWAAGFSFNVEPVTFGAGFDSHGVMSIGMGFTQGLISMNALYSTDSDHDEADNEAIANVANAQNKAHKDYIAKSGNLDVDSKVGNKPDLKNQAMGVDMTYQMSDTTSIVLVAAQHKKESARWSQAWTGTTVGIGTGTDIKRDPANDKWVKSSTTVDAFGVGFSHDLGGGATLKAGAGSVDSNAVADLGITMKF